MKIDELTISLRAILDQLDDYDPEKFENIFKWCADEDRYDFIQRRMSSAKIREFVDSGGALPEGLTLAPLTKVAFRRS